MIDFRIKKASGLVGHLNIQFVYDKSADRSQHDMDKFDFLNSIYVKEDSFFLIEPIFFITNQHKGRLNSKSIITGDSTIMI